MNSETNHSTASNYPVAAHTGAAIIDSSGVEAIRHDLHDLANIFTGVMIAGGLLGMQVESDSQRRYAADICESSERGSALIQKIRSRLLAACGETGTASSL